jgi:hypothetical protein
VGDDVLRSYVIPGAGIYWKVVPISSGSSLYWEVFCPNSNLRFSI